MPCGLNARSITAGVYESDTAKFVRQTFNTFRETQNYSTAATSTMAALQLSRPSVTSYLPYEKGVYFPEDAEAANISASAERQRHYRAVTALKKNPCEENLWKCVMAFRGYKFKTLSGLPFTYKLKKGKGDEFTKELCGSTAERTARALSGAACLAVMSIASFARYKVSADPSGGGDAGGVQYLPDHGHGEVVCRHFIMSRRNKYAHFNAWKQLYFHK